MNAQNAMNHYKSIGLKSGVESATPASIDRHVAKGRYRKNRRSQGRNAWRADCAQGRGSGQGDCDR